MHNFIIVNKETKEEYVVLTIEQGYSSAEDIEGQDTNYLLANLKTGEMSYEYSNPEFKNKYTFKKLVGLLEDYHDN